MKPFDKVLLEKLSLVKRHIDIIEKDIINNAKVIGPSDPCEKADSVVQGNSLCIEGAFSVMKYIAKKLSILQPEKQKKVSLEKLTSEMQTTVNEIREIAARRPKIRKGKKGTVQDRFVPLEAKIQSQKKKKKSRTI